MRAFIPARATPRRIQGSVPPHVTQKSPARCDLSANINWSSSLGYLCSTASASTAFPCPRQNIEVYVLLPVPSSRMQYSGLRSRRSLIRAFRSPEAMWKTRSHGENRKRRCIIDQSCCSTSKPDPASRLTFKLSVL